MVQANPLDGMPSSEVVLNLSSTSTELLAIRYLTRTARFALPMVGSSEFNRVPIEYHRMP